MKVVSYTICHYGKDFLPYALKSVQDHVDESHIIYSPHPSHGHTLENGIEPVETREEIINAAFSFNSHKVVWHETSDMYYENHHRDYAVSICQQNNADLILVLDCDEVWPGEVLEAAIKHVWDANSAKDWLINFTHLWRSFNWCCRDELWPVRFIDLRGGDGPAYVPKELGDIYHFGYAVTDEVAAYKWKIHGHRDELRPEWFAEKWSVWPPTKDIHPTNERGFWNPEPFDKGRLPSLMREHPFYGLERIE